MLIESYELKIRIATHSAEHFEYEAIAHLDADISPVLPYLNATLSRGLYLPDKPVLSWRHEGHSIGFWPERIAADDLESREEAKEMIEYLVGLVNETWNRREQLEPDTRTHERLQPLEIYQLLPKTNCKECGEDRCFSFALKLVTGQVEVQSCRPLYEETAYEGQRTRLETLLASKWPAL